MIIIIFLCRLDSYSWLPHLREYGYELVLTLAFELGLAFGMVMVAYIVSTLKD